MNLTVIDCCDWSPIEADSEKGRCSSGHFGGRPHKSLCEKCPFKTAIIKSVIKIESKRGRGCGCRRS